MAVSSASTVPTDSADAAALVEVEAALIARLPADLRGAIFRPTDRLTPAARIAGLRRVVALYEGAWAAGPRTRLAALRDRYAGQRLFILGNGPSLRGIDLDRLAGQPSIGVNGLFLAFPGTTFRPTCYLVEDHLVAEDRAEALNALPAGMTRLFPLNLAYCLDDGPDVVWFDHRPRPGFPDRFDVSLDALARTYAGGTVVFTALQLAAFMGARDIVLLGVDLDYALPADVRRQAGTGRAPGVLDMASDDPNHFHPDYFGKGMRWHDPNPDTMARALSSARDVLAGMGVRLINATPGGRMTLMPRLSLDDLLAGRRAMVVPPPRLLVFDLTPIGGASATGQFKGELMAPWRGGSCLAVTPDARSDRFTVHHPDGRIEADLDPGATLAWVRAFAPQVVYYRPQPRRGHLHPLVLDWLDSDPAALILHVMDDWLAPMRPNEPLAWQVWRQDLDWLAGRAAVRLAISPSMAAHCRDRHGGGAWKVLANGIDPADWPARDRPSGGGCVGGGRPFDLLFAGALAEDMNRAAVRDVAEAVDAINRAAGRLLMRFEVRVLPPWRHAARVLASDLVGVAASVGDDPDPGAYRARLRTADGVLIAYAFDEISRAHTRHSMANKLPEALASGAAVVGYGPADQATLAALAGTDAALLVTERDPDHLRAALIRLVEDADLSARLGAAGRRLALEQYTLAPRRAALADWVRAVAADRAVLSGDHPRLDGARLDEAALLLGLARFQTMAPGMLVDVGAHHGGFLGPFAEAGWSVLAVEPDPANRAALEARHGTTAAVTVAAVALSDAAMADAPLYTAPDSSGVATLAPFLNSHRETARVPVETLTGLLDRHGIAAIDVLKVDAEGWDFRILMGLDWDRWRPRVVMAEFENAKTLPLGVSLGDLVALLEGRGYAVLVSEWHPVVRYGARHDWRRLFPWPPGEDAPLPDPDAWGNLIALRADAPGPDHAALAGMVRAALTLAPRPQPAQDLDAPPEPETGPAPKPETVPGAPRPAPPSRLEKGRRLGGEMADVLGGWRAPAALGLVAAGAAAALLPPPLAAPLAGTVVAGLLAAVAYGSVRARRLDAIDREATKARLDERLRRHVGWLRDDLSALRDDLARDMARLSEDQAEARDGERLAREAADRHVEAALIRHLGRVRDALVESLGRTNDRIGAVEGRLSEAERASRDTAGRLDRAARGLAESLASARADLARENAARDTAWRAAVAGAERAARQGRHGDGAGIARGSGRRAPACGRRSGHLARPAGGRRGHRRAGPSGAVPARPG